MKRHIAKEQADSKTEKPNVQSNAEPTGNGKTRNSSGTKIAVKPFSPDWDRSYCSSPCMLPEIENHPDLFNQEY